MSTPTRDTHALVALVSATGSVRYYLVEHATITPLHALWLDMLAMDDGGLWAMHAHLLDQTAPVDDTLETSRQTLARLQAAHADFHPEVIPALLSGVPDRLSLRFLCASGDAHFTQTITRLATLRVYYVVDRRTWGDYLASFIFSTPQTP